MHPYIYRTHDNGKTWKKIVKGLPDDPINAVREDPFCKGLLYAGSECAVYVSFDDGESWQPLRLNMPCTSIRDLVVKDNDLVVATHGRSFWILDDITALRHIAKQRTPKTVLYETGQAYRVRWNMNPDTPLPQEEPAGPNPPDGAIIDYYLEDDASTVSLEISDASGRVVRTYRSDDTPYHIPPVNIPLYWIRPQQLLSADEGAHRFTWDLHYQPIPAPPSYAIGAIYGQTPPNPISPWVMPGKYTVKLTVDGVVYRQPLTIKMDPRVKTSFKELQRIHTLSYQCYQHIKAIDTIIPQLHNLRKDISNALTTATGKAAVTLKDIDYRAARLEKNAPGSREEGLEHLKGILMGLMNLLNETEMPATTQVINGVKEANAAFGQLIGKWKEVKGEYGRL